MTSSLDLTQPSVSMTGVQFLGLYELVIADAWDRAKQKQETIWGEYEACYQDLVALARQEGAWKAYLRQCWEGVVCNYRANYWHPWYKHKPPLSVWRNYRKHHCRYRDIRDFVELTEFYGYERAVIDRQVADADKIDETAANTLELLSMLVACAKDFPTGLVQIPVVQMLVLERLKDLYSKDLTKGEQNGDTTSV